MLRDRSNIVEADLRRFYGVNLTDHYRRGRNGRRLLTLRQIYVYLTCLPPESLLAAHSNGGSRPWGSVEYLLADLWEAQANRNVKRGHKPRRHPARPVVAKRRTVEEQRDHDARMRKHRRQYQRHYAAQGTSQ